MKVFVRETGTYEGAEQYGGGALKFLYENPVGRILLGLAVSPVVSDIYAFFNSKASSAKKIPGFIKKYNIDMSEFEDREYGSFKDFFTRRFREGARSIDKDDNVLVAPADSKLLVYEIDSDLKMKIKGSTYTISELLGKYIDIKDYNGGYALVYRLCMDDCHRYCFVDDGVFLDHYGIKGKLHTVSSISKDYKIYKENTREISVMKTRNFDILIQIEVGALLVGRINNCYPKVFVRGDEKGFFEPGGSTIVILVNGDTVSIDEDIMKCSGAGVETKVKLGERVGKKK